jgi:hypothetical protein
VIQIRQKSAVAKKLSANDRAAPHPGSVIPERPTRNTVPSCAITLYVRPPRVSSVTIDPVGALAQSPLPIA